MRPPSYLTDYCTKADAILAQRDKLLEQRDRDLRQNDRDLQEIVDRLRKPVEPFHAQG